MSQYRNGGTDVERGVCINLMSSHDALVQSCLCRRLHCDLERQTEELPLDPPLKEGVRDFAPVRYEVGS